VKHFDLHPLYVDPASLGYFSLLHHLIVPVSDTVNLQLLVNSYWLVQVHMTQWIDFTIQFLTLSRRKKTQIITTEPRSEFLWNTCVAPLFSASEFVVYICLQIVHANQKGRNMSSMLILGATYRPKILQLFFHVYFCTVNSVCSSQVPQNQCTSHAQSACDFFTYAQTRGIQNRGYSESLSQRSARDFIFCK
jgi:hypothetical protein